MGLVILILPCMQIGRIGLQCSSGLAMARANREERTDTEGEQRSKEEGSWVPEWENGKRRLTNPLVGRASKVYGEIWMSSSKGSVAARG